MSHLTDKAIKAAFMKLLEEQPFEKITVKDIVEECGINRNTFYYHFQDIYALLQEILDEETEKSLKSSQEYLTWQDGILQAISFALENKKALYHIYNSVNRVRIEKYLHSVVGKIMKEYAIRQAAGIRVSEEDISMVAAFYQCALVGMLLGWLDDGMKADPEEIVHRLGIMLEGNMKNMLKKAGGQD